MTTQAVLLCPACGGANPPDAIFCANERCHKALGEFRYVGEEVAATKRWHESLAERATRFLGQPHFLVFQGLLCLAWIVINTSVFFFIQRFDAYPFGLLSLVLAAEAIFMAVFILVSQNRQNAFADKRAELDYEVSVRTYREVQEIASTLQNVQARLQALEARTDSLSVNPPVDGPASR